MLKLLIPSLPHRQPSPSFFGVLSHLFLTHLCFDEDMGEGKVEKRKERDKGKRERGERLGDIIAGSKSKHTLINRVVANFPLIHFGK